MDIVYYFRRQTAHHIGSHFPTFYNHYTSSSLDIALTNRANFFNYALSPGPLTTSDHIPIILDISTPPLLAPSPLTFSLSRTDWDTFKGDDALQMTNLPDVTYGSLEEIDEALETWMTTLKTTADRHIPKTTFRLRAAPRPSRTTQLLRMQFQAMRDRATTRGWTYDDYRRYNQIKVALQDSRQAEAKEHWGRKLASLAANYRHPRKFWREIKCLSGRTTGPDTYLLDHTGEKFFTNNDKEEFSPTYGTISTVKTTTMTLMTMTRC